MQLYARHQQGNPCSVNLNNSQQANVETQVVEGKSRWANMGDALRTLRNDPHREGIDRRFNAMITATTIEELLTHLRHLISILKAKNDVKVNYANLSQDLLWLQRGQAERVRMRWGQSYYCSPDVDNIEEKGE